MKANLIDTFLIISVIIGCLLILTAIIRIVFQNQSINAAKISWLIVSATFILGPAGVNVAIEWGELKVLINQINEQAKRLEQDLHTLGEENSVLVEQTSGLLAQVENYKKLIATPGVSNYMREEQIDNISNRILDLNEKASQSSLKIDSAIHKNIKVQQRLDPYRTKKWFKKE